MNEQQRAVVQQALEALKGLYAITEIAQEDIDCRFAWAEMPDAKEAITALRQLLEQPEPVQEPVLWMGPTKISDICDQDDFVRNFSYEQGGFFQIPLYTTPPAQPAAWVGLTDEEVMQTMHEEWLAMFDFARLIEAKLREKNGGKA
jgi:hypothetical protein